MITAEKLKHHISHLQEQHDLLDKQIQDLYAHHADDFKVEELKKKKLHLRDEIENCKKQLLDL
jgi:hypothetical protein